MKFAYTLMYLFVAIPFNICHPSKVIGREHIKDGRMIICPNHTSLADPLFMLYAFPLKYRFRGIAKEELMRVPVIGWVLKQAGIFGISRGNADITAIKTAMKVLKDDERLLMFPEGTRIKRSKGETGEAKTGVAMLSVRCDAPIMPVYIPEKQKWFRPTTIVLGEPYMPQVAGKKGTAEEYEVIAKDLMTRINKLSELV